VEEAGAAAYFYKPINLDRFLNAVQSCLAAAPDRNAAQTGQPSKKPAGIERSLALADRLEVIRRKAKAGLAALLDSQGNLIKQTGLLDEVFNQPGLAAGLARLYASGISTAQKLGCADYENLFYMAGKDSHFYLASVNPQYVLVLTMEHPFHQQIGEFNHWLPGETRDLDRILSGSSAALPAVIGPLLQPEREADNLPQNELPSLLHPIEDELVNVEVSEGDRAAVEAMFSQTAPPDGEEESLDDFWDNLAEKNSSAPSQDGGLSYDQAREMGLAPPD
jgi:hypothetical protein